MGWLRLQATFKRYLDDESGAAAVEYAMLTALLSVAIIVAIQLVGTNMNIVFMRIAFELQRINTMAGF